MKNHARTILAVAELRARTTHTTLAALLDTSEQLVQYHLKKAEEEGFILGYNAVVDHGRIGCSFHLLYLSFFGLTAAQERRWLKHVSDEVSGVALVARTVGRWSAILGVVANNNIELSSIITESCKPISGKVAELAVTSEIECTYTSLQFLARRKAIVVATGNSESTRSLDLLDRKILEFLAKDCRLSASDIARRTNSSGPTISRRIQALEEEGIILGYRVHIDYEKLGYHQYRLLLRLSDFSPKTLEQLRQYLLGSGIVESVSRYLGMADMDLRCYTPTLADLADFVAGIRDKFSDVVTNVEIVPVFYWRRMNYFPGGTRPE